MYFGLERSSHLENENDGVPDLFYRNIRVNLQFGHLLQVFPLLNEQISQTNTLENWLDLAVKRSRSAQVTK